MTSSPVFSSHNLFHSPVTQSHDLQWLTICVCVLSETVIDLGKPFKKAYKKGKAVKLFTNVKKSMFGRKKQPKGEGMDPLSCSIPRRMNMCGPEITYEDKEDPSDEAKEWEFEEPNKGHASLIPTHLVTVSVRGGKD